MKFPQILCFSTIFCLFSFLLSAQLFQIRQMDEMYLSLIKEVDSITFISTSFCKSCEGKGFQDLEEWKEVCRNMWGLNEIDWSSFKRGEDLIYFGKWNGPYGRGEVYAK